MPPSVAFHAVAEGSVTLPCSPLPVPDKSRPFRGGVRQKCVRQFVLPILEITCWSSRLNSGCQKAADGSLLPPSLGFPLNCGWVTASLWLLCFLFFHSHWTDTQHRFTLSPPPPVCHSMELTFFSQPFLLMPGKSSHSGLFCHLHPATDFFRSQKLKEEIFLSVLMETEVMSTFCRYLTS